MPRKTGRISIRDKKSGKCGEPGGRRLHQNAALEDDVVEADEPEITRVDTSHMGKIGKMAHFIGSQAADEEETDDLKRRSRIPQTVMKMWKKRQML